MVKCKVSHRILPKLRGTGTIVNKNEKTLSFLQRTVGVLKLSTPKTLFDGNRVEGRGDRVEVRWQRELGNQWPVKSMAPNSGTWHNPRVHFLDYIIKEMDLLWISCLSFRRIRLFFIRDLYTCGTPVPRWPGGTYILPTQRSPKLHLLVSLVCWSRGRITNLSSTRQRPMCLWGLISVEDTEGRKHQKFSQSFDVFSLNSWSYVFFFFFFLFSCGVVEWIPSYALCLSLSIPSLSLVCGSFYFDSIFILFCI